MPDIIPPEDFDPRGAKRAPQRRFYGNSKRAGFVRTTEEKKPKKPWWEKYGKERISSSETKESRA